MRHPLLRPLLCLLPLLAACSSSAAEIVDGADTLPLPATTAPSTTLSVTPSTTLPATPPTALSTPGELAASLPTLGTLRPLLATSLLPPGATVEEIPAGENPSLTPIANGAAAPLVSSSRSFALRAAGYDQPYLTITLRTALMPSALDARAVVESVRTAHPAIDAPAVIDAVADVSVNICLPPAPDGTRTTEALLAVGPRLTAAAVTFALDGCALDLAGELALSVR